MTLVPAGRLLKLRQNYRLTVNGTAPAGLTSVAGIPLAGSPGGVPGTSFVARFNRQALAMPSGVFGANGPSQAGRRRASGARQGPTRSSAGPAAPATSSRPWAGSWRGRTGTEGVALMSPACRWA